MNIKNYRPRIADDKVEEYLEAFGAVCIEGPKWSGKTWTSRYHSNSEYLVGNPEEGFQNRKFAELSPDLILQGDTPRLIDEWQEVPSIWDAVRYRVDDRGEKGQFILTGSSTPVTKGIMHSGVGRIGKLRLHPMSLYESGHSSGVVSLGDLCRGKFEPKKIKDPSLTDIVDNIVRGGWPGNQDSTLRQAARIPKEYIRGVVDDEIHRLDNIQRDKHKVELLLRSLARNESTLVTNKTLQRDIKELDDEDIDKSTVSSYLDAFSRMFLIENQKPFSFRARSSLKLRQAEKRHFADPSLACALLDMTPDALFHDLNTLGFLFESLCERDLRIYAESFDGELYHYKDYNNNEIDAVIKLPNGDWCAFEVKLGANSIDEAAENLKSISKKIAQAGGKEPTVCGVICGIASAAYQREDGVYVVPIYSLKN